MNPRIQKITDDIAKRKRRIASDQARVRDLERQRTELENADIVAAVRGIDVPPEELAALIRKLQSQAVPHLDTEEACFEEDED